MKRLHLLLFFLVGLACASCGNKAVFSAAEHALINGGAADVPFRVLQVTDPRDSLMLGTPSSDVTHFAGDPNFNLLIARLKTTLAYRAGRAA